MLYLQYIIHLVLHFKPSAWGGTSFWIWLHGGAGGHNSTALQFVQHSQTLVRIFGVPNMDNQTRVIFVDKDSDLFNSFCSQFRQDDFYQTMARPGDEVMSEISVL